MNGSSTIRAWVTRPEDEPPANEIPAMVDTDLSWRGDGIVIAIPSLLVYTTGVEPLIICRTRYGGMNDDEHSGASRERLRGLRANGIQVQLLRGYHQEHGFTYSAWVPFIRHGSRGPDYDLAFELEWPGIGSAAHSVSGIAEAVRAAEALW